MLVLDNGAQRTLDEVQKTAPEANQVSQRKSLQLGAAERFQKSGADFA
ncbi:hypothetical protein ACLB1R_35815 [Escherichia coli]